MREAGGQGTVREGVRERAQRGWSGSERASKSSAPSPFLLPLSLRRSRQAVHTTTIHPSRYVECDARLKRTKERTTFFGRPLLNSSARGIYRIFCCEIINISSTKPMKRLAVIKVQRILGVLA